MKLLDRIKAFLINTHFGRYLAGVKLPPGVTIANGAKIGRAILGGYNYIGHDSELEGEIKVGYATTFEARCILRGEVTVGNYCQFAPNVAVFSRNHPYEHVTNYINRSLLDGLMKDYQPSEPVLIGNDVWIGYGAIITKGVSVGNGAVIGAGSVVISDVEDYTIVAGNPAKLIKNRFDKKVVELLQQLRWWEFSLKELDGYKELFEMNLASDPDRACELLRSLVESQRLRSPGAAEE